jgi:protein amnionless
MIHSLMKFLLLNLLIVIICEIVEGRRVVWTPKTNIGDAGNWEDNKVPCPSDIVEFPDRTNDLNIFTTFSAKEIILPKSGGFILDGKATINFAENDSKCDANTVKVFKRVVGARWLDARNWNVSTTDNDDDDDDSDENDDTFRVNKATPHEERLPCDNDEIIFPINNSNIVDLQFVPSLSFKSVTIDGRTVAVNRFREFLSDLHGQSMFRNTMTTIFEESSCNDENKCVCHQKSAALREQLCENEQQNCPKILKCSKPFRPIGHCCDECGSMLHMKIQKNDNFNLKQFKTLTRNGKNLDNDILCCKSDFKSINL